MSACCVSGCKNRQSNASKIKFFRIPSGYQTFQANRRRLWLETIQQVNGSAGELGGNARICGAHFISGGASMDFNSPDFAPSVFTCAKAKLSLTSKIKAKWSYQRRKSQRRRATMETEEITTPPRADSPMDHQSPLSMEAAQTPASPSVPEEGERVTQEADIETEAKTVNSQTTSRPNKASFKVPTGIPQLDKMIPIVCLKSVFAPAAGYRCEVCNQSFTDPSQLVKHKRLHEEEKPLFCEKLSTGQADVTEHQHVPEHHHVPELSFPCNMCHRTFTTSHNLKRHKLLHVKDGRKCHKCGVLFCQRHNHVVFLPQAESEQESFTESEDLASVSMPENGQRGSPEPNKPADLDNDAQSTMTVTHVTASPAPQKPGTLFKTHNALPPASHTRIRSEIPIPVLKKSSYVPRPAPSYLSSKDPTALLQPHLPQHPQLPPSLKIFSPQCLTSAFLEVERNYDYILSKPVKAEEKKKDAGRIVVKEEQCDLLLIPPDVERRKKKRTAFDLELML